MLRYDQTVNANLSPRACASWSISCLQYIGFTKQTENISVYGEGKHKLMFQNEWVNSLHTVHKY